jgi:hypothetical protein
MSVFDGWNRQNKTMSPYRPKQKSQQCKGNHNAKSINGPNEVRSDDESTVSMIERFTMLYDTIPKQ